MKYKKMIAVILVVVFGSVGLLAGCGTNDSTDEEATEVEPVIQEEVEEVVTIQEIGDATASIEIMMSNEMGGAITDLSVKSPLEKEYPDSMMSAGQKIENDETVKLFYKPVTEEDLAPAEGEAVLPDESYVGYWNESDDIDATGWELTIFEASEESATFHLWGYRTADSDDYVVATFDSQNVGSFSTNLNDSCATSGTIMFYKDSVVVVIEQSELQITTPITFVFNEKHDISWEEGNNSPLEQWELDHTELDEDADADAEVTEEPVYFLRVTMENGEIYEFVDFDVEDMDEVTLYLEDDVAYIEYMSLSQNIMISTKEKETQIKTDKEAAQAVDDMIAAIGDLTEENAEEHRDEIEAAREAYDILTDAQKAYVTNLELLEDLEDKLNPTVYEDTAVTTEVKESVDSNAYNEGFYCGDSGYTEEDAKGRAAELGYTEGSKSYQAFWEGYDLGFENRNEGDFYIIGFNIGLQGYSEEEARADYTRDGSIYDPKSDYVKSYWAGYYDGYAIFETDVQGDEEDWDEYEW